MTVEKIKDFTEFCGTLSNREWFMLVFLDALGRDFDYTTRGAFFSTIEQQKYSKEEAETLLTKLADKNYLLPDSYGDDIIVEPQFKRFLALAADLAKQKTDSHFK